MTNIVKDNSTVRWILEQVVYDIEKFPTAYDVEKVIRQLKENKEDLIKPIKENSPSGFYMVSAKELMDLIEEYTQEQIEIVKSGGVADE